MPRDPAKRKAAYARYRSKPEVKARRLAYSKQWRTSRRDHVRAYDAEYRRIHAEKRRAYDAQYRLAHGATPRKPRRPRLVGQQPPKSEATMPPYEKQRRVLIWSPDLRPRKPENFIPFVREYHGPPDLPDESDSLLTKLANLITEGMIPNAAI